MVSGTEAVTVRREHEEGSKKSRIIIKVSSKIAKDAFAGKEHETRSRRSSVCEIAVLSVIIGLSWIILLEPIIFYHLPDKLLEKNVKERTSTPSLATTDNCFPYPTEGGLCQGVLVNVLLARNCSTQRSPLVLRDDEITARLVLSALNLSPSEKCRAEAIPLLCLYLFGACDSSGVSLLPSSSQCRHIRDNLCSMEWRRAVEFGLELPDCDNFPDQLASCGESENGTISDSEVALTNSSHPNILPCRENFFRVEGSGACVPSCHSWVEFTPSVVLATDLVVILSATAGLISGIAVLVMSVLRYKQIFVFPTVFIIYMTCDILVIIAFMIITYFDRSSLYCSSQDLRRSYVESTPFCAVTGIVFAYCLIQTAVWWLCHTSALLWSIKYPFKARIYKESGKSKWIHVACAATGITIPLVPVLAEMANFAVELQSESRDLLFANLTFLSGGLGFAMQRAPPILCFGSSADVIFYSNILPIVFVFFLGLPGLVFLFSEVHKHYGRKKSITSHFKMATPERKVLISLCYYALLMIIVLPAVTLAARVSPLFAENLQNYFLCEEQGFDKNNPDVCNRFKEDFREFSNPEFSAVATALLNLYPVTLLPYVVDFAKVKKLWMKIRSKNL